MKSTTAFRPQLETLAGRVLPSAVMVEAPPTAAASEAVPLWTGPLGGTVTVTKTATGNQITETVVHVGPNGRT